ncbi:12864_t:CDS:2 [Entrophospora sp. SA101]|nr:12864_t:CDS:2 [Entrophospora sp. SA101]
MRGRPKDGFTWNYFDDDENGTDWQITTINPTNHLINSSINIRICPKTFEYGA